MPKRNEGSARIDPGKMIKLMARVGQYCMENKINVASGFRLTVVVDSYPVTTDPVTTEDLMRAANRANELLDRSRRLLLAGGQFSCSIHDYVPDFPDFVRHFTREYTSWFKTGYNALKFGKIEVIYK